MATTKNGFIPIKGSLGDVTYYMRNGKVVMRKRHTFHTKKSNSVLKITQGAKIANLIDNWRVLNLGLKDCFEIRKPGWTAYNAFVSTNLMSTRVFLTREEAQGGAALADQLTVSRGSLPYPVQVDEVDGWALSSLKVNQLPDGEDTLMVNLVPELIFSNVGTLCEGDRILFVRLSQYRDTNSGFPMTHSHIGEFRLDRMQTGSMRTVLQMSCGSDGFAIRNGRLAARLEEGSMVAWVVVRPVGGGLYQVTSQKLVGHNALLEHYCGPAAEERAVQSYLPH